MKIIKIKNCLNCPLSSNIENKQFEFIALKCESGANFNHKNEIIKDSDMIPDWCPLENN